MVVICRNEDSLFFKYKRHLKFVLESIISVEYDRLFLRILTIRAMMIDRLSQALDINRLWTPKIHGKIFVIRMNNRDIDLEISLAQYKSIQ